MATTCDRPLGRCINLSRRQHLRNALFDALHRHLEHYLVGLYPGRQRTPRPDKPDEQGVPGGECDCDIYSTVASCAGLIAGAR